jgi:exopolysaccharide production protein ExoZ
VLNETYPILVPGWSLNYEAFFYALFGCALLLRNRLASVGVVLGALILLALGGLLLRPAGVVASFYCNPIILEFAFGLWVGVFFTHLPKPPLWLGLAAVPLGLLGVFGFGLAGLVDNHSRVVLVGLPAALAIWGVTVAKRHGLDPKWPVAVGLGDASYSIYLTHVMVLPAAARLWSLAGIGYQGWRLGLFMTIEVLLAALVGYAVHRLVEQPVLDLLRARFEPRRPQFTAVQAQ